MNDGRKLRVLLVDDDETYARVVSFGLVEEFGFEVQVAPGGQEAIEVLKLRSREFDVVVLDYRMPRISGIDVLRWMHQNAITVPAFILTAAGSETVVAEAMKYDAYDYFRKEETDIEKLANHIRATHDKHMARLAAALDRERAAGRLKTLPNEKAVRDFVQAMGPAVNAAFSNIADDLDSKAETVFRDIPKEEREELKRLLSGVHMETDRIETAVRGLLSLYALLEARHPDPNEITSAAKKLEDQALRPSSDKGNPPQSS